jgi:hypothetical protein
MRSDNENEMVKLRVKMCGLAERIAQAYGVTLDYSHDSVSDVERILGELHDEYRDSGNEHGIFGIALEFGAYLVAVIERHHGPIDWKRDHETFGKQSFPLLWKDTTLFPVGWCLKRIMDGPSDDILSKWQVCVLARTGGTAAR